jgi:preprotein translocase subunit SecA
VVLNILDTRWKEHLKNIDTMKEGIGLMGYAQKNPIVEYKLEAYNLFTSMRSTFMLEALSLLSRLEIQNNTQIEVEEEMKPKKVQTVHGEVGQFGAVQSDAQGKSQPVRRAVEKLGRNDPCWCGSGKKYKLCHMESDMSKQRSATV